MNFSNPPVSADSRHVVMDLAARDEWVDAKLMRSFMRSGLPALHSASMVIPIIVVVLYGDVDNLALFLWTLAAVGMTLWRYRVVNLYNREYAGASGAKLRDFTSRHSWTWTMSAVVWGSSMFLYFRKAPVYDQFICLIVLAGMAGFAVGAFSASLRYFIGYTNGLAYSILAAVAYSVMTDRPFIGTATTYGLVVLVLIYWMAIRLGGRRFNQGLRKTFELQFANSALIASLTEKTRTALEAVEAKNRFIASAAHDLRQPVHALSLYADWLQAEPELVLQITPKIVQSTQAVNELFNSLFDLAKLDAGVIEVNLQRIDLRQLLQELELQYAPLACEKGLTLRTRLVKTQVQVLSDPVLLKRLLGNLLSNAVRHTERGGVLLAVRRASEGWRVDVWDTGVGVAPEHQEAIFREFYRVAKHQGTEEGFGLGLSIVSRLSEALGHRVSMRSVLGRGTLFRVDIPAFDEKAEASGRPDGSF